MRFGKSSKYFSMGAIGLGVVLFNALLLPTTAAAVPISEAPAAMFAEPDVNIVEDSPAFDDNAEVVVPAAISLSTQSSLRSEADIAKDLLTDSKLPKSKSSVVSLLRNWLEKTETATLNLQSNEQSALAIVPPKKQSNSCGRYIPIQRDYLDKHSVCTSTSIY